MSRAYPSVHFLERQQLVLLHLHALADHREDVVFVLLAEEPLRQHDLGAGDDEPVDVVERRVELHELRDEVRDLLVVALFQLDEVLDLVFEGKERLVDLAGLLVDPLDVCVAEADHPLGCQLVEYPRAGRIESSLHEDVFPQLSAEVHQTLVSLFRGERLVRVDLHGFLCQHAELVLIEESGLFIRVQTVEQVVSVHELFEVLSDLRPLLLHLLLVGPGVRFVVRDELTLGAFPHVLEEVLEGFAGNLPVLVVVLDDDDRVEQQEVQRFIAELPEEPLHALADEVLQTVEKRLRFVVW